jgi:hypothetical protein
LIICAGRVHPGDAQVMSATGTVQCCCPQTTDPALEKGLAWLGSKFSASRNPSPFLNLASHNLYYYLYGVERVGRFTGQRFIGRHDWYRQGAEVLVAQQDGLSGRWRGRGSGEDDPLVATSFALLFLSKGRRPVVLGKLSYGESPDWNAHRSAVPNLARRIEQRWKRDLSWQTIDIRAATVEDLLEAPVLLITGRSNLPLSREQKENLRQYVNRGGFIFADASCGDQGFDRAFRALIRELFPTSPLRLLPPEHPVWYAEERVDPAHLRKLYGVEACCRTSIVYCAEDLSCYWELSQGSRGAAIPKTIQDEIEACLRIGENVVTYATNRELKNKLDRPQADLVNEKPDLPERGVLKVPKLTYDGGGDDAPHAIPALLSFIQREAQLRVAVQNQLISATETSLHEYPVVFMHGRRTFRFSPAERKSLAEYAARGGVLFADAICGSSEFADSFRREMDAVFSGGKLERIPPDHPLFTRTFRGFDLTSVTLRDPQVRGEGDPLKTHLTQITPLLEGLKIDDRYAVIFSPYDISCALETGTSPQCKGYTKEDAARLGLNVLLFALQQ